MRLELVNRELQQGFRLGEWLVRPLANKLTNDDGDVHVEPKVMDVLLCLADAKDQVVTRRELVKIAPNFPDAHGLKAYIQSLNSVTLPYGSIESTIEKSYQAALTINPFQEEALMAKAISVRWQSWDWRKVRSMFERALAAAPNWPRSYWKKQ